MTDIVERLRGYGDDPQDVSLGEIAEWSHKAADEIERLRAELAGLKEQEPVGRQHRFRDPDGPWSDWINGLLPSRAFDGVIEFEQRHIYAAPVPAVDEKWRPIETAPYKTVVRVKVGNSMTFEARLMPDASLNSGGKSCDQWQAVHEGEHPEDWSDGACWESNADEMPSSQPTAWRPIASRGGNTEPDAAYFIDATGCEHMSRDVANIERINADTFGGKYQITYLFASHDSNTNPVEQGTGEGKPS
ncbi:hypothetical protein [Martelella limonii]|uniref:hypothetical protein n=1 Tax=Martelella limonii TaxID=1647649 RepID=UPI0015805654|nr:hypothetical protein [Martelella limonii]